MAKPTPDQIRDAFTWVAWWETGGAHPDAQDRSARACEVLGDNAYWVLVDSAHEWNRRNTAVSHG